VRQFATPGSLHEVTRQVQPHRIDPRTGTGIDLDLHHGQGRPVGRQAPYVDRRRKVAFRGEQCAHLVRRRNDQTVDVLGGQRGVTRGVAKARQVKVGFEQFAQRLGGIHSQCVADAALIDLPPAGAGFVVTFLSVAVAAG
jgi:hypothetical protein